MTRITSLLTALVVVALAAGAWATTGAQGTAQSPSGSLAELTAEVRQLRFSIEGASRGQTQLQALSISLSAQQGRLTQVANRLDGITEQLNKASDKTRKLAKDMADAQAQVARLTGTERAAAENYVRGLKYEYDPAVEEENSIRTRYNEALNSFRTEEARWLELVAKLEEIIKK